MSKPNFGQKVEVQLNCDLLRPLRGKSVDDVVAAIRLRLSTLGGDPSVAPTLTNDYGWAMTVPKKLTAEQRKALADWEAEQASLKIVKAREKIQKLAAQAGLTVEIEG